MPFGPYLTCSQCGKACLDHYSVSNNVWCPECAAGRIHPTGQPPKEIILPPPMGVTKEELALRARRARLLDYIDTTRMWADAYPMEERFQNYLQDLKDELAAVESALGYPEPKEPIEASEDDKSGPANDSPRTSLNDPNSLGSVGQTESGVALDSLGEVLPPQQQEHNETKPKKDQGKFCPICLCLYEHEDPMQSCVCGDFQVD